MFFPSDTSILKRLFSPSPPVLCWESKREGSWEDFLFSMQASFSLSSVSYVTFVSSLLLGLETLVWFRHQMNTPYPTWIEECRCLRLRESGWRSLCGYLIILFLASLLTVVSWSKWNFWDFMWSVSCWVAHNAFPAFCLDEQQTHTYKLQLLRWASSGEWEWFGDLDHHWRNMWGIIKSWVEGLPW